MITQMQISELMQHYIYDTLPDAFDLLLQSSFRLLLIPYYKFQQHRSEFAPTNTGFFSIKITGPSLWNSLPIDLNGVSSRPLFKKQIKLFLVKLD